MIGIASSRIISERVSNAEVTLFLDKKLKLKSCSSKNIYAHLRIYSKETKTMEYFLVGFWVFVLLGYFPTWDVFLMGFCPLGFCPHGIFFLHGILSSWDFFLEPVHICTNFSCCNVPKFN